jgi:hypothetical protein
MWLRREYEQLEASLMTYTGEHLPSVDELEQTGNIPPEALPPSPSLFGCLVKNNVGMAKTILAIVAINSLLVPLAAATDHDSYNAVPAPAPVPSKFATAAAAPVLPVGGKLTPSKSKVVISLQNPT